ncbi:MAG TPA: hypothetical protein VGU01_15600 [Sphingomicrobium sp.]|nr:hypothetical protein [Sphingomicrobium sp.]
MRKLPALAFAGVAAALLGGTAVAASRNNHVMMLALPDGSTARVEYAGDVAPRVTIEPLQPVEAGDWTPLRAFAGFDRMIDQMNSQAEALIRAAQRASVQPVSGVATPSYASVASAPGAFASTTIVSYSNGNSTCTRSTETVSQGPGKPPKVTSSVSGKCGAEPAPGERPKSPALDHT